MIGIIQRFGMATEVSHRKITVIPLYYQIILLKDGIASETELGVVVEMLHDCWIDAFPIYMFDNDIQNIISKQAPKSQRVGVHWGEALSRNKKQAAENQSLVPVPWSIALSGAIWSDTDRVVNVRIVSCLDWAVDSLHIDKNPVIP